MTLVCAAAGFGKTTLVSAWLESLTVRAGAGPPAAWLSLDGNDSDLEVFLLYFIAALRKHFPVACAETLALIQAPQVIPQTPLFVTFANELEQLPARAILVLDDYHAISGEAVPDFLSELVRHWPQRLHLVVISRTNPPLPLADLRAKGQLTEVRTRDLRFTAEEATAFLQQVSAVPLSEATVALLARQTEGWVAALRLLALSLRTPADAEAALNGLAGTNVEIADYMAEQVVAQLTPEVLKFLLVTSILNRFCAALCESLVDAVALGDAGKVDSVACIQWLVRANLFVMPLDNERKWYRYHHLFQELLQRRLLAEVSLHQVAELHRAAAAWLSAQGLTEEALHHALAINDLDLAARLMEDALCDVLNREDRLTAERWLRMLPPDFVKRRPWLLAIQALALQFAWRLAAVPALLGQIETLIGQRAEDPAPAAGLHNLPALRGVVAALHGQVAFTIKCQAVRAIEYCDEALVLLPEAWRFMRGAALLYWGLSMRASGRVEAAQRALLDEYESQLDKTNTYAVRLLMTVCLNYVETAQLEEAGRLAQAMLDHATRSQLVMLQGWAHYCLGLVHYCWNDLDGARSHFAQLVDERYAVNMLAAANGMIGVVLVHLARSEFSAARPILELSSQYDLERAGREGDDVQSLRAQLEHLEGNRERAYRWADAFVTPVPDRLLTWLQDPHIVKVRILLARGAAGDVPMVLGILSELYAIAQRSFNIRFQIVCLALQALAQETAGNPAAADLALQQAVNLAQAGGFLRVFVDLGTPMQTMLRRLAEQGHAAGTINRILAAFPQPEKLSATRNSETGPGSASNQLIEHLTGRELEILALLRARMSDKEIAQKLNMSPATVKRHTSNIYGKLGVNRRWDAVIIAERLGILPP